jgi:hypothetical protein
VKRHKGHALLTINFRTVVSDTVPHDNISHGHHQERQIYREPEAVVLAELDD